MDKSIEVGNLKTPQDVQKLKTILQEAFRELDVIYTETAPNGSLDARQGALALYNNSGTYTMWVNTTGSTVWQQIDADEDTIGADKALGNLASVAINASLIPASNGAIDLGSDAKEFKDLWIDGTAYLDALTMHGNLNFNDNQAINMIIENRTDDTGMTVTGQIWFRTDI